MKNLVSKHLKRLVLASIFVLGYLNIPNLSSYAETIVLEGVALKDDTNIYEATNRNSSTLKSYDKGTILLYQEYSQDWYEALVYVDGNATTGYINKDDVETKVSKQETLKGIALKNETSVFSKASTNSTALKSYGQGSILYYQTFTSDWYEALVYIHGQPKTGYIHKDDVDNIVANQETLKGIAVNKTNIYTKASNSSNTLKSYNQGSILYYQTFTSGWYEALVYIHGNPRTGYIRKNDVDNIESNQVLINGISKEETKVYSKPSLGSTVYKSYGIGKALLYSTFTTDWYEALVYVNGKPVTGYIHKDDVESKLNEQTSLKGIGIKNKTKVYSALTKDSKVLKSYSEGSILYYKTLSENWNEALVYVDGSPRTGYIHINDVENTYNHQESLMGPASKSTTNVYSKASRDSKVLKSYDKKHVLYFKTFSKSWYEALVYVDGKPRSGYIHVDDVSVDKRYEETTKYARDFKDLVDIWYSKSPQIWTSDGWKDASRDDVAYYANPTNFDDRNANSFYQYLVLSQPASLDANEINTKILFDKGSLIGTAEAFILAGKTYSVNEVYLLAHALHETGNGTSELAQGVIVNGKTVYNMYGIGAKDTCPVECGAQYAYDHNWFTPKDAIIGGAQFIGSNYINKGQDTLYKMRWNPAAPGTHQYATDVNWALAQTHRIADWYSMIENYVLFFDIPEYSGTTSGENLLQVVNITTSLNVRESPIDGKIISSLYNGQIVTAVTDKNGNLIKDGDWFKIYLPEKALTGWISGDFIKVLK